MDKNSNDGTTRAGQRWPMNTTPSMRPVTRPEGDNHDTDLTGTVTGMERKDVSEE